MLRRSLLKSLFVAPFIPMLTVEQETQMKRDMKSIEFVGCSGIYEPYKAIVASCSGTYMTDTTINFSSEIKRMDQC